MTKEQLIKDIKYYTGLMLNLDSIKEIDIHEYEKLQKNSFDYWGNIVKNPDELIDMVSYDNYVYLQEKYNM